VTKLQEFLTAKGFFSDGPLATFGYFGNSTRDALARYQQSAGLSPADGFFGVVTRAQVRAQMGL